VLYHLSVSLLVSSSSISPLFLHHPFSIVPCSLFLFAFNGAVLLFIYIFWAIFSFDLMILAMANDFFCIFKHSVCSFCSFKLLPKKSWPTQTLLSFSRFGTFSRCFHVCLSSEHAQLIKHQKTSFNTFCWTKNTIGTCQFSTNVLTISTLRRFGLVWFISLFKFSNSVIKVVLQSQNSAIIHKSHKSCSQFGGALFGTVLFLVGNWHSDNISTGQNIYSDVIDPCTGILSRGNIQEANSGWILQTEQFGWRPRDLQS
jgi:hypothetical protein